MQPCIYRFQTMIIMLILYVFNCNGIIRSFVSSIAWIIPVNSSMLNCWNSLTVMLLRKCHGASPKSQFNGLSSYLGFFWEVGVLRGVVLEVFQGFRTGFVEEFRNSICSIISTGNVAGQFCQKI
ncbi:hypothetical protein RchiOBHm_Chr5g0004251 [Rosa chinensis]|uniref:Uncharacterized protein n=1 Tax=Rosa chinensis TaxID=74649 RepID=A0A2P6Q2Z8_ROSCH|nr:hypothetical protein RchiOBHm_Chr5g0004251 [Rosa chinensis]